MTIDKQSTLLQLPSWMQMAHASISNLIKNQVSRSFQYNIQ